MLFSTNNVDITEIYSNNMNSSLFTVTWTEIKSALVSAVLAGVLAGGYYIANIGSIFTINWHDFANTVSLAAIVAGVSVLKSLLTNASGKFVGAVNIK